MRNFYFVVVLSTGDREMMDLQRKLTNYRGTLTGKKLLKVGVIRKCNRRGVKKEVYLFLVSTENRTSVAKKLIHLLR